MCQLKRRWTFAAAEEGKGSQVGLEGSLECNPPRDTLIRSGLQDFLSTECRDSKEVSSSLHMKKGPEISPLDELPRRGIVRPVRAPGQ